MAVDCDFFRGAPRPVWGATTAMAVVAVVNFDPWGVRALTILCKWGAAAVRRVGDDFVKK